MQCFRYNFCLIFLYFPGFRLICMVGEACLSCNIYFPWTPDYTLTYRVHVCSFEHSDLPFVNQFMSLLYGLCTMTTEFLLGTPSSGVFLVMYFDVTTRLPTLTALLIIQSRHMLRHIPSYINRWYFLLYCYIIIYRYAHMCSMLLNETIPLHPLTLLWNIAVCYISCSKWQKFLFRSHSCRCAVRW